MKKYLLFSGAVYYASGGAEDFNADFDSIEEAREATKEIDEYSWWQIVDSEDMKILEQAERGAYYE